MNISAIITWKAVKDLASLVESSRTHSFGGKFEELRLCSGGVADEKYIDIPSPVCPIRHFLQHQILLIKPGDLLVYAILPYSRRM